MPGLGELRAGAGRIRVGYEDMAHGGRVRFTTKEPKLVQALHDWLPPRCATMARTRPMLP